jgi:hypothetical protein
VVIISLRRNIHIKRSKYPLTLPILLVKYSRLFFWSIINKIIFLPDFKTW